MSTTRDRHDTFDMCLSRHSSTFEVFILPKFSTMDISNCDFQPFPFWLLDAIGQKIQAHMILVLRHFKT